MWFAGEDVEHLAGKRVTSISEHDKSRRVVQTRCLLNSQEFRGLLVYVQVEWCPRHPGENAIRRGGLIGKIVSERQGRTSPEFKLPIEAHENVVQKC